MNTSSSSFFALLLLCSMLSISFSLLRRSSGSLPAAMTRISTGGSSPSSSSSSTAKAGYSSISVPPGTMPKEEQPCLNPINSDSCVLLVGATRGIGLEFAKQITSKGARLVATYRDENGATAIRNAVKESSKVELLRLDVGATETIAAAAKTYQGPKFSHIIINAGIYGARLPFGEVTSEEMMNTYKVNTVGPLMVVQEFISLCDGTTSTKTKPIIAILSSKVGSIDDNGSGGSYIYRASKSAINQVAKSLSIDLQFKAKFVLLHPGYVKTDMTGGAGLIDTTTSVRGMLKAIEATNNDTPFRFVDYKADQIPW